jgi:hypothetical protein
VALRPRCSQFRGLPRVHERLAFVSRRRVRRHPQTICDQVRQRFELRSLQRHDRRARRLIRGSFRGQPAAALGRRDGLVRVFATAVVDHEHTAGARSFGRSWRPGRGGQRARATYRALQCDRMRCVWLSYAVFRDVRRPRMTSEIGQLGRLWGAPLSMFACSASWGSEREDRSGSRARSSSRAIAWGPMAGASAPAR